MVVWIILFTENLILLALLLIWINRRCQQCHKVKCIERSFNKLCWECYQNNLTKPVKSKKVKLETVL